MRAEPHRAPAAYRRRPSRALRHRARARFSSGRDTRHQPNPELSAEARRLDGLVHRQSGQPGTARYRRRLTLARLRRYHVPPAWPRFGRFYHGSPYDAGDDRRASMDVRRWCHSFCILQHGPGRPARLRCSRPPIFCASVRVPGQNFYISPRPSQLAAIFPGLRLRARLDGHSRRCPRQPRSADRDPVRRRAQPLRAGRGAFSVYADISRLSRDGVDFCRRLLAETSGDHPGLKYFFDRARGGWIRLSFAGAAGRMLTEAARPGRGCRGPDTEPSRSRRSSRHIRPSLLCRRRCRGRV